jgi:hypothetical protein
MTQPHQLHLSDRPFRPVAPARPRAAIPRPLLAALGALAVLAAVLVPVPSASAASYQYWGYYQLTGTTWSFSQKGPAETTPAEGSVEGWRWAVDDGTGANPRTPRAVVTFDQACGQVPAEAGKKRVGVVVDYGRPADGDPATTPPEPTADCAVVATAATGAEVLAAVATVRNDTGGLVCGINSYPATGCGGEVATLTDAQKAADTPVSIGVTATPQGGSATTSADALTSVTPATPGTGAGGSQTAGPVVAPAPAASTSSGVPAVVWVGLVILLLGAAVLAWSAYRRRRTTV